MLCTADHQAVRRPGPTRLSNVPVLAHPVIFELAGIEICAEPASRPRWHFPLAQDGTQHGAEMAAHTRHPVARIADSGEQMVAEGSDLPERFCERAGIGLIRLLRSQLQA